MSKDKPEQSAPPTSSSLDAIVDKKRFTYREVWIIVSTIIAAAVGLGWSIIETYGSFKISLNEIAATVKSMNELQKTHNEYVSIQLAEIKKDIEKLENAVFKPNTK